jgi:PhzF family phenazine biosynthesis protein
MTALNFRLLNVFAREGEPLSGNPLCVFEHGDGLDAETMQALARQFNLSETTFILPSKVAQARVRIFTPSVEMPFAGHPVLGTAHVCRSLGLGGNALELETQSGLVALRASGDHWSFQALAPSSREVRAPRADLARMLGLEAVDVLERPLWIKSGKEQLIIPLATPDAVRRAKPTAELFAVEQNDEGRGNAYVFAATEPGRGLARYFFASGQSVGEDPATGSATANLGGWWLAMGRPRPAALRLSQGEAVGRPSALTLEIDGAAGVRVSGLVFALGAGTLSFQP